MPKAISSIFRRAALWFPLLYIILRVLFQPSVYVDNTMVSAMAAWGEPSPYLIYPSYLLGCVLAWLRMLMPQVEWFSVALFLANLGCVAIWAHCLVKPEGSAVRWREIVAAGVLLVYMVLSLRFPYYSVTSSASVACGLVWMLCAFKNKRWVQFVSATLFLLFGASIRFDSSLSLLPFCAMLGGGFLLKRQYGMLAPPVLVVLVVAGVYLLQPLCYNFSQWETDVAHPAQNAIAINNVRMRFFDYDDRLERDKMEEFAQLGLSENDFKILAGSSYQLERRSEPGWFEKLGELRMRDNGTLPMSWKTFLHRIKVSWEISRFGLDYYYVWLPVLLLCLLPFPKSWKDPRLVILVAYLGDMALLVLMGRCPLTPVVSVAYLAVPLLLWTVSELPQDEAYGSVKWGLPVLGCVFAGALAALLPNFSPLGHRYPDPVYYGMVRKECAAHPERNYYIPIYHWGWKTIPSGVFSSAVYNEVPNLLPDKDYMYLAPSVQSELKKRGIPSDLTILLQENTRFIYNEAQAGIDRVAQRLKYWDEHHGIKLHLEKEYDLENGYAVYKVVREPGGDDVPLKPEPYCPR